jgi:hypothetical protein
MSLFLSLTFHKSLLTVYTCTHINKLRTEEEEEEWEVENPPSLENNTIANVTETRHCIQNTHTQSASQTTETEGLIDFLDNLHLFFPRNR